MLLRPPHILFLRCFTAITFAGGAAYGAYLLAENHWRAWPPPVPWADDWPIVASIAGLLAVALVAWPWRRAALAREA